MKKTLLSILFATALSLNVNASGRTSPQDLHKSIIGSEPRVTSYYSNSHYFLGINRSTRKIKTDNGYEFEITASERMHLPGIDEQKTLTFDIKDDTTKVCIYDPGLDGFNKQGHLSINHRFKNGDCLSLCLQKVGIRAYNLSVALSDDKDHSYAAAYVDSTDLNWVERKIVEKKSKPILDLGQKLYQNILDSANIGKAADLPYEDIKKALDDVETLLPSIRSGKKEANSALLKLADSYIKLAKQRAEQLNKLEEGK
jgi:hypothetical protein